MQILWEEKSPLNKVSKVQAETNSFWMVRELALAFGSQFIGVVLSSNLYTSTVILDWRYFYSWWTWMFFKIWWFRVWSGPNWCSLLSWRSSLQTPLEDNLMCWISSWPYLWMTVKGIGTTCPWQGGNLVESGSKFDFESGSKFDLEPMNRWSSMQPSSWYAILFLNILFLIVCGQLKTTNWAEDIKFCLLLLFIVCG